jgi:hypothetical protein
MRATDRHPGRCCSRHPGRRFLGRWAGIQFTLALALPALAHTGPAPNRVDISPSLSTSGQPTRDFLRTLKANGVAYEPL